MNLWIATTNKGKLSEFKLLLDGKVPGLQLRSLAEIPSYTAPPETGATFLDNARIKAKSLRAMKPGDWVLADDSGLEVAGLGGLPGVHSARYAGPKAADSENLAKLLKMLQIKNVTDRAARFVCCLVAFDPQGTEWSITSELKGTITKTPAGQHGFGYDPVFLPEGETQTLAQLGAGFKNQRSHRAQAARAFLEKLKGS